MSLQVFDQMVVVLCSLRTIKDLLEKCGETYADRPRFPVLEMYATCPSAKVHPLTPPKSRVEMDWLLAVTRMSKYWRDGRKVLDRSFGPVSTAKYRQMIKDRTHLFLGQLLEAPDDFIGHIGLLVRRSYSLPH